MAKQEELVTAARSILPMIGHTYLLEDARAPGTGIVVGQLIGASGEDLFVPLGVIAPDGSTYLAFMKM